MHEHTEQFHLYRLNSLCRICGSRSQKKQQKQAKESPMQCRNYAEDLKNVLGVVVSQDTDGTVCSSTMCSKCYFTLKKLKRKACSSGKTKERAVSLLQKSKFIWTRYNGSLSAQDCSVCSQFLYLSRGGRPLKPDTSSSSKHSSLTEESVSYVSLPSESTPVEQAALATEFQSPSTSGTETSINDNSVLRFSPPSTSTPEHIYFHSRKTNSRSNTSSPTVNVSLSVNCQGHCKQYGVTHGRCSNIPYRRKKCQAGRPDTDSLHKGRRQTIHLNDQTETSGI